AGVIAGLDMGDRRDLVISVFRWQGATQLAFGLALLAVALRYRSLTPLFLVLVLVERGLMAVHGWVLSPTAPGADPEVVPPSYALGRRTGGSSLGSAADLAALNGDVRGG
ncbi:MAG: hypothetical protein ACKODL_04635, partial [Phenylobacterium sp.]